MTPQDLKHHLTTIQANQYATTDVDVPTITEAMLSHIGDPDPELRDDLLYPTLARWIRTVLDAGEKRMVLHRLLDEHHLFYEMGVQERDSVFTRTFSLLALAVLLYHHRETPFLSADEVQLVLTRVLDYAREEQDLRGYTGTTGWAHSTAHLADVLDELALCEEIGAEGVHQILQTIQQTMTTSATSYHHEEDERMAYATLTLFGRGVLPEAACTEWITGLPAAIPPRQPFTIEGYRQRVNLKQYLRSLYFQATHKGIAEGFRPAILSAARELSLFA